MKIIRLFQILLLIKTHLSIDDIETTELKNGRCIEPIVQTYGFVGFKLVFDYTELKKHLSNNYCPDIKYSCCKTEDFELSNKIWQNASKKIKLFTTKIFRIINQMALLQTSLLQIEPLLKNKTATVCNEIDFNTFNQNINNQDIFFYLQNSLDSFVFLQKGFYCLICDYDYHQYFSVKNIAADNEIKISEQFCNDIIFYFKEFLIYKTNFIDPIIFNTDKINACINDENDYKMKYPYGMNTKNIKDCIENGQNCHYVCKNFVFGSSGDLLIGKMETYRKFFENFLNISQKLGLEKDLEMEDKIIDHVQNLNDNHTNFFDLQTEEQSIYKLDKMQIIVAKEGINLFKIANNSNYMINSDINKEDFNVQKVFEENIEKYQTNLNLILNEEDHQELPNNVHNDYLNHKKMEKNQNEIKNINKKIEEIDDEIENKNVEEDHNLSDKEEIEELDKELDDFGKEEDEVLHNKAFNNNGNNVVVENEDKKVKKDNENILNGNLGIGLGAAKSNIMAFFVYFTLLLNY